jgi:hypothetical protein
MGELSFAEYLWVIQGITPTWQQQEFVEAVDAGERRITVRSGHGTGKSFIVGQHCVYFHHLWPDSINPITGTVFDTLKDTLWKEVASAHKSLPARLRDKSTLTTESLRNKENPQGNYAVLRTSSKDKPEAMSGFHSPHLLLDFDEASGIPEEVFNAARGSLSTPGAIQVLTGNPTRLVGRFHASHHSKRKLNHCLHWNSEESPNVDPLFCQEIAEEYGKESNEYRIRVLGEFPTAEEDALIPLDVIMEAVDKDLGDTFGHKLHYGVDVGWQGNDPSVLLKRKGNTVFEIYQKKKTTTMEVAGLVMSSLNNDGDASVKVDVIGIGAGVVDRLQEQTACVKGISNAEKAMDSVKFANVRAESYWSLRELFLAGHISIPDNPDLIAQLSQIKYNYNSRGQCALLPKDKLKKEIGCSPDHADALALAFYEPPNTFAIF